MKNVEITIKNHNAITLDNLIKENKSITHAVVEIKINIP